MRNRVIRRAMPVAALVLALFAVTACAGRQPAPSSPPPMSPSTVTIAVGAPATLGEEGLSLSLVAVHDDRCPVEVRCVWAGHAAVTLKVSQAGADTEITIGTPAPSSMNLPFEATAAGHRFSLVRLEPAKSLSKPAAQADYRATIQVSKQ